MLRKVKRLKTLLLIASLTLGCIAVLEAGQEIVDAVELHDGLMVSIGSSSPLSSPSPSSPLPAFGDVPVRPSPTRAATPRPQTLSQRRSLALNTGNGNDPNQPVASVQQVQIAQAQVATSGSAWYGASFPVENFQEYTSPFGYRLSPSGGYTQEFHYGLDMAAPEGSYVRNWWSGRVVEVTDNTNCGTSVVVESGEWTHIYCHMQGHVEEANGRRFMIDREGGLQIFVGQDVVAGLRIGRVGMTGRTTGPHLHWGLKYQGNWVDPALVIRAMYSQQASIQ